MSYIIRMKILHYKCLKKKLHPLPCSLFFFILLAGLAENAFSSASMPAQNVLAPKSELESIELKSEALKAFKNALEPRNKSETTGQAATKNLVLKNQFSTPHYYVFLFHPQPSGNQKLISFEVNSNTSEVKELSQWDYSKNQDLPLNTDNILRSMPDHYQKLMPKMVNSLNYGVYYLKQKYGLHATPEALSAKETREKETGKKIGNKPEEIIRNYLEQFMMDISDQKKMHDLYVIKPENFPESYYLELQKEIAREQGHGDIKLKDKVKNKVMPIAVKNVIDDQISTLQTWLDYFSSPDSNFYPDWAKYWAFRSMVRLSSYDKEKKIFADRDKNTVAPFPDLNREALASVIDLMVKKTGGNPIPFNGNNELEKLVEERNFGKLYAYALENATPAGKNELFITSGQWVKYLQGSDPTPLIKSLQGFGTGWCTAGESTAQIQLSLGDFFVYYSNNKNGNPVVPRIAIRMEQNKIGEVRGIAHQQNLDPYMVEIAEKKLKDFSDGPKYQKKTEDMKYLTEIEKKQNSGMELDQNDLIFLYETESQIEGFGFEKDPRIEELKNKRNKVITNDYSVIYSIPERDVLREVTPNDRKTNNKRVYIGEKVYTPPKDISLEELQNLNKIIGLNIDLTDISQSVKNELITWNGSFIDRGKIVSYPGLQSVSGDLIISKANKFQADSLQSTGGNLNAKNVRNFKADSLQRVGGGLNADNADTFNANSLKTVGRELNAPNSTSFGADSLEEVGTFLVTSKIREFKANSLKYVGWYFDASKARTFSADSLQYVGRYLDIRSAEEVKLDSLQSIGWYLDASKARIFSADSLQYVGWYLDVRNAARLILNSLQYVGWSVYANRAEIFESTVHHIGKHLDASSALTVNAPLLKYVGIDLNAPKAEFKAPHLHNVGGKLYVRQADLVRAIMSNNTITSA